MGVAEVEEPVGLGANRVTTAAPAGSGGPVAAMRGSG